LSDRKGFSLKLRIRGNSIRLRLGESEVAQLAKGGRISESTQFSSLPGSELTCTLATSPDETEITASFAANEIKVTVPEVLCRTWANSEQVGLKHEQRVNGEVRLSIVIEKDFRCLEPRPSEDQSDSFPNPAQGKACNPH
jgi:hypothetical protein